MLLIDLVFVITMIRMDEARCAPPEKEIEEKVEGSYAERAGVRAGWGVFLFVFLMVLREGRSWR